ncbi:hypothetical protein DV735_g1142, partial [Chaetothyriales sp. CBS 134920]
MSNPPTQSTSSASPEGDLRTKTSNPPQVRRRNRLITSCLECRRRKLKCDKLHPCTNCNRFSRECIFLAPTLDSISQQKLNEIKDKMGSLERTLEEDVVRRGPRKTKPNQSRKASIDLPGDASSTDSDAPVPEDEKALKPNPLVVADVSHEDDATDDMLDLGIRVGKLRMTERLGGFFRPKMAEELGAALLPQKSDDKPEEKTSADIKLLDNATDFLEPGPTYIAPGSGLIFGDVGSDGNLVDFLPPKEAADELVSLYYQNVHFLARVVHWPSFQVQYERYWTTILARMQAPPSRQALVFSILFAAVASMSESSVASLFGRPKEVVQAHFRQAVEMALSKAQFLRTTKIETMQALVIYLIPMCRDQMSRAHSVLVGTAIRLGECMGLHRDPADVFGLPAIECHIRRILWFQLCFLDFRTAEIQGPFPSIRREDYDTKFPSNIDDADLARGSVDETATKFTDMTLSRIRFECNEMHRIVWYDRLRLEKKKVSLTHVVGKIESFRKVMEAKYDGILDVRVPIQHYARLCLKLLLMRLHVMVLHRYMGLLGTEFPSRFRQIVLKTGTSQLEAAFDLETVPTLERWRWYNGTHQQWHTALLLLVEVYWHPDCEEADRIWKILDYVFEPDPSHSRPQKARSILNAVQDRTAMYRHIRRARAPTSIKSEDIEQIYKIGMSKRQKAPSQSASYRKATSGVPGAAIVPKEEAPAASSGPGTRESMDKTADAANQSWSFDKPQTFLIDGMYGSKTASQLPPWTMNQQRPYDASLFHSQAATPHLDFSSPSESSTIQESWPPFISNTQVQWQTAQQMSAGSIKQASPMMNDGAHVDARPQRPPHLAPPPMAFAPGNTPPYDDTLMPDIDWNEWDRLFPPDQMAATLDSLPSQAPQLPQIPQAFVMRSKG